MSERIKEARKRILKEYESFLKAFTYETATELIENKEKVASSIVGLEKEMRAFKVLVEENRDLRMGNILGAFEVADILVVDQKGMLMNLKKSVKKSEKPEEIQAHFVNVKNHVENLLKFLETEVKIEKEEKQ